MDTKKIDLIHQLKRNNSWNKYNSSDLWGKAFELYNKSTPDNLKFPNHCSTCYKKVKKWLLKH